MILEFIIEFLNLKNKSVCLINVITNVNCVKIKIIIALYVLSTLLILIYPELMNLNVFVLLGIILMLLIQYVQKLEKIVYLFLKMAWFFLIMIIIIVIMLWKIKMGLFLYWLISLMIPL